MRAGTDPATLAFGWWPDILDGQQKAFSVVFLGRLSRVRKSNSDTNWFRAFFPARHHGRMLRVCSGRAPVS
jgi:hypothetical protein